VKVDHFGYTKSDGFEIAYMTEGSGPPDILYLGNQVLCQEVLLDEPVRSRLLKPIAEIGRVITFDRRGIGLSEHSPGAVPIEDQVADVLAVLDAVGSHQVAVIGWGDGAMMATMFAASHPQRVSHLTLFHGQARITKAEGYEWAMSESDRRTRLIEPAMSDWGKGKLFTQLMVPVWAAEDGEVVEEIAARGQRLSGTPGEVRAHLEAVGSMDVREILPRVQAPTLVLDRPEATAYDSRHSAYLAECIPRAELSELPGRDSMIMGDGVEAAIDAITAFITGTERRADSNRALSTVAFTDIVDSTGRAAELGDAAWRELLARHDGLSRELVERHGGTQVKSTGDGFLATFDGPARAVRAASALTTQIRELGIELRAGVHTGEVEILDDDVAGIAVHIGARISALAGPGEVLASSTVRDLVVGSGIKFDDRGEHRLKGVPGDWRLCRVARVPGN
jgi:class 3 adenylate cyclase